MGQMAYIIGTLQFNIRFGKSSYSIFGGRNYNYV